MADIVISQGEAHQGRPNRTSADGNKVSVRQDRYGNLAALPAGKPRLLDCMEGSYFLATNPTPGTAIDGIAAADGVDDTEAYFYLRNENSVASGKQIILDRLVMQVEQAGASGTDATFVSKVDSGSTRYSSGGSEITPVNPNMGSSESSGADLRAGAVVLTAASGDERLLDHGVLRTVTVVVGDEYTFEFGGETPSPAALATAGSAQLARVIPMAPVVLDPEDAWYFQINAASQSGASGFEFRLSWFER